MEAQVAEAYFLKHHKACRQHILRYARRADSDDLHRLRVAIKKIKAILTIARDLHGLDIEPLFAPYRSIFRQAGAVREATLIRDQLADMSTDKKAIAHRTHIITGLSRKLKAELPIYLREVEDMVDETLTTLRAYDINVYGYCQKLYKKLKKRWRKTSPESNYHSLRKHLKQFLYSASLLPPVEQESILSTRHLRRIDRLQDLIGQWHDAMNASARILTDVRDHDKISHKLRKDTQKLRSKIIATGDKVWA